MFMVRTRYTWSEDVLKFLLFLARVRTRGTCGAFRSRRSFTGAETVHASDITTTTIITFIIIIAPHLLRVHGDANAPIVFFPQHGHRPLRAFRVGVVRQDDLGDGREHDVRRRLLGQREGGADAAHGCGLGAEHVGRLLVAEEGDERAVERGVGEGRARVQRGAGEGGAGGERA